MVTDWKAMGYNLGQDAPPPTAGRVFGTPAPAPQPANPWPPIPDDMDEAVAQARAESLNRLAYDAQNNDPLRAIAAALVHLARYGVPTWED